MLLPFHDLNDSYNSQRSSVIVILVVKIFCEITSGSTDGVLGCKLRVCCRWCLCCLCIWVSFFGHHRPYNGGPRQMENSKVVTYFKADMVIAKFLNDMSMKPENVNTHFAMTSFYDPLVLEEMRNITKSTAHDGGICAWRKTIVSNK